MKALDVLAVRNLLLNPKLKDAVLKPLGYPPNTFRRISAVVEAALEGDKAALARSVERLVRILK